MTGTTSLTSQAFVYTREQGSLRHHLVNRPSPQPGPDEVAVAVKVSGVNPIDWKTRERDDIINDQIPGHDGAGVIVAVGENVSINRVGQRVWIWGAAWQRDHGTAQEHVVLPQHLAVPLPDTASFDTGATIGIPALTAHRCLTLHQAGPTRLSPSALTGRTVLVAGGAGAVGHAAIQLAKWAGAFAIATVSSPMKQRLAHAAGADVVLDNRTEDIETAVSQHAPTGVDIIVDVAAGANSQLDRAVLAPEGVVAFYAGSDTDRFELPVRWAMVANARWQGVFLYTIPPDALNNAVAEVSTALADGALSAGAGAGLPLHRYPLAAVSEAHDAAQHGVVGKVLIEISGGASE